MDGLLDIQPLTMDKSGMPRNALSGEVAVITGGAGNIGLATSRCLAWLGAKVVIASRNPQTGQAAADLINKENKSGTALFLQTDVADETSMKNMAVKAIEEFGKVDILVNNAMDMSLGGPILKASVTSLDKMYQIAVRGALLGIQAFLPGMRERHHGVITYLSTTFRYPIGPSSYCAIKASTSSMIMSLAYELGPVKDTGIAVFMFLPAFVGRPRSANPNPAWSRTPVTGLRPSLIGYEKQIPPEDCGAALSFSIVHAAEIHGSGIGISQAQKRMHWPFPRPDRVPKKEFDRVRDPVMARMFAYIGPGWPDNEEPLVTINRSQASPEETLDPYVLYED
jgi:NAD(P)-dependent dehydrogenase (short-subunit alcohol dehydrogenase family)